tara:strand:+ start:252 stop:806 length:555 start_codon:yes stop_codon:yes gene_type:complete
MSFSFNPLIIPDVILIKTKSYTDTRGYFMELFRSSIFENFNIKTKFIQDSISHSKKDVIRGLHFQNSQYKQAKLITVLSGEIFDVLVDIRKNSPTYGKYVTKILNEKDHDILYVPEGFAHGFCVLSNYANILYKMSSEYSSESEKGIIWNDLDLDIPWPISNPLVSDKDQSLPRFKNIENDFEY